jgi:hypothetical protein
MEELYEYRTELLARSLEITDDLRQVLESLPENSLFNSPIQGRPSPHRVLAHLRDIHVQALSKRLKQIQSEESPRFILFDDEAWLERHYRMEEPWQAILEAFTRSQEQALAGLDPKDASLWNRTAHHPWFGKRTFQWWVEQCLEYSEHHLEQIRSALPGVE